MVRETGTEISDIAKVSFSTPGSRYDREFTVDCTLNKGQKALLLKLKTPWKKADITGWFVYHLVSLIYYTQTKTYCFFYIL